MVNRDETAFHSDKAIFIMAGIHAVEYPAIRATQRLAQEIDTLQVTSVIVILPILESKHTNRQNVADDWVHRAERARTGRPLPNGV